MTENLMQACINSLTGVPNPVRHQVISANLPAAARFEIQGHAKLGICKKVHSKNNTSCGEKYSLENSYSFAVQKIINSPVFLGLGQAQKCGVSEISHPAE